MKHAFLFDDFGDTCLTGVYVLLFPVWGPLWLLGVIGVLCRRGFMAVSEHLWED